MFLKFTLGQGTIARFFFARIGSYTHERTPKIAGSPLWTLAEQPTSKAETEVRCCVRCGLPSSLVQVGIASSDSTIGPETVWPNQPLCTHRNAGSPLAVNQPERSSDDLLKVPPASPFVSRFSSLVASSDSIANASGLVRIHPLSSALLPWHARRRHRWTRWLPDPDVPCPAIPHVLSSETRSASSSRTLRGPFRCMVAGRNQIGDGFCDPNGFMMKREILLSSNLNRLYCSSVLNLWRLPCRVTVHFETITYRSFQ